MERNEKGQFLKGGKPTAEELVIKSKALSDSWKSRSDYIGDIKDVHPRIYNSWRSIRFTEKGRSAGCVEQWKSFRSFYNDVEPTYEKGKILRRRDIMIPWGPDNFMWIDPSDAGIARTSVTLTYKGETLSIKQWADKLSLPFNAVKLRYYRFKDSYSVEEILFGRKTNRGAKKVKDVDETIRAKASKMISSYRAKDRKNGVSECDIDIDWMIANILLKPCHYCGDSHRVGCDRISNDKGHTKDNVVPCCIECNTARNNYFSYEEMRLLGQTIAQIKEARGIVLHSPVEKDLDEWIAHDTEYRRKRCMHKTYQFSLDGRLIAEYGSVAEAALAIGVTPKTLSAACTGRAHSGHKCAGFLWTHTKDVL